MERHGGGGVPGLLDARPRHVPASGAARVDADLARDLAGASGTAAVASALVARTAALGRAAAVVTAGPGTGPVTVAASVGFGCGAMTHGSALPLTAGLPVTEAARTGEVVVVPPVGPPRWVAVPLGAVRGALLLCDPHGGWTDADTAALAAAGRLAGAALRRARTDDDREETLRALAAGVRAGDAASATLPGVEAAWVVEPRDHDLRLGGDVVLATPDGRGGGWLVVADACGHGPAAASSAAGLRAAALAVAGLAEGPAALLAALDRAARASCPDAVDTNLATALAVHTRAVPGGAALRVASAGHPLPLLRRSSGDVAAVGTPGLLLGLDTTLAPDTTRSEVEVELAPGDLLVLHTDGLVDAPTTGAGEPVLLEAVGAADPEAALAGTADRLVAAVLDSAGPAGDDVALLVAAARPAQ